MITFDRKQYILAKTQLNSIQFVNSELAQIQAESIGWVPLEEHAYLYVGSDEPEIAVVVISKPEMQGSNVLWLF